MLGVGSWEIEVGAGSWELGSIAGRVGLLPSATIILRLSSIISRVVIHSCFCFCFLIGEIATSEYLLLYALAIAVIASSKILEYCTVSHVPINEIGRQ